MSEAQEIEMLPAPPAEEGELVEARPTAAGLSQPRRGIPAVQAAAAAAGGFVAGAAVVGLVGHRRSRALAKGGRPRALRGRRRRNAARSSGAGERLQIVGSRSLLLDVHLLGGAGPER
jgi:hypothetical protein